MRLTRCCLSLLVLASAALASKPGTQPKDYVILAKGSSNAAVLRAVAAAGGSVTASLEGAGVVLATSADPAFESRIAAATEVQGVSPDVRLRWIPDNERNLAAARVASPTATANAEPYNAYLWNLRQIGADRTASAGYLGEGAVVAVLDEGI